MDDASLVTPKFSFRYPASSRSSRGEETRHQRLRPLDDVKSPDLIMRPMPSPTCVDDTARRFVDAVKRLSSSNPKLGRVLEYIKSWKSNENMDSSVSDTIHKIKSLLNNHEDLHLMFDTYVSVWGMSGLNVEVS